jgi:hypothetical protein
MSQLKAFVGHSFLKEDEEVVRTFLEFFDHVKGMGIGFDWDHAKPAEPKTLAEKVLTLAQDKNLFIGICTKKECNELVELKRRGLQEYNYSPTGRFFPETSDYNPGNWPLLEEE